MNTTAHILFNAAVLDEPKSEKALGLTIFTGAVLPDAAMFIFFAVEKINNVPDDLIWNERYFDPVWQNVFDIFNSIPLALAGLGIGLLLRKKLIKVFFTSVFLHIIFDFLLHNDDAHRHFLPFSDWRFISPVSYWDPNHFGFIASCAEIALSLACFIRLLFLTGIKKKIFYSIIFIIQAFFFTLYLRFML